jgi:two-component system chemotaxis sensor kinase CheA
MMLPLTLAVLEGLEVKIGKKEFILPVAAISETLQATPSIIRKIGDKERELVSIRDELIPVIRVHRLLNIEPKKYALEDGILLVSNYEDKKAAIFVDEYGDQNQVAVKSLEKNFIKMGAFSSATVKSDGSIGLILDVGGLVELQKQMEKKGIL